MSAEQPLTANPLEGRSPFELRVNQSGAVPESAVKKALATGDMGFLHSFTTGSTVDGPGVRLVGLDCRLSMALLVLPQPRHLEHDERYAGDSRASNG